MRHFKVSLVSEGAVDGRFNDSHASPTSRKRPDRTDTRPVADICRTVTQRPCAVRDLPLVAEGIAGTTRVVPDVAFVANPENLGPIPTCDSTGTCVWQVNGGTPGYDPATGWGVMDFWDLAQRIEAAITTLRGTD